MAICSAINCHNQTKHGFRLFKFPTNPEIRRRWQINCHRDKWVPTSHSRLCEVHFEEDQFELNRADGWRKLKWNAVPTMFDFTTSPSKRGGKKVVEAVLSLNVVENANEELLKEYLKLKEEIVQLKSTLLKCEEDAKIENNSLTRELNEFKKKSELQEKILNSFLTKDQIKCLCQEKMKEWGDESILKAHELRTHLGAHGYEFLRSSGYPLPNSQTLIRHIDQIEKKKKENLC